MMKYVNFIQVLIFMIVYIQSNVADGQYPKGHLKPLGSHRAPGKIEERHDMPTPLEFWNEYVKISRPVVFRGAAKHSQAFTLWTDEYLKENYGNLEVRLERKAEKSGRVPIGAKGLGRDTIANFVDNYHGTNSYIVSELPTPMWKDINVQPCVTCGTFADRLVEVDLWMSGGGSTSLLHKDAFNAINCLYNGTKEWKMIEYKYENMIYKAWEPAYEVGGYSLLDVDSVDLIKYPKVVDVPWSFVTINAGDCLFLPKSYYHQVNSYGSNNIAVAILFSRLDNLENYHNTGCESKALPYVPLSQLEVDWKYPGYGEMTMGNSGLETARELLKGALQYGPITLESIPAVLTHHVQWRSDRELLAEKVFEILSKDGRTSVNEEDIDALTKDDLRELLLVIERYEPSNMDTYEYSYVREQDIRLIIDTLIRQDGRLNLEKFVDDYKEHLGGTELFAVNIFKGFMSKDEKFATADEVGENLDAILKPYIEYRRKAGLDDDLEDSDDVENRSERDKRPSNQVDDHDDYIGVSDNDSNYADHDNGKENDDDDVDNLEEENENQSNQLHRNEYIDHTDTDPNHVEYGDIDVGDNLVDKKDGEIDNEGKHVNQRDYFTVHDSDLNYVDYDDNVKENLEGVDNQIIRDEF